MKKTALSSLAVILLSWMTNTSYAQLALNVLNFETGTAAKDLMGTYSKAEKNFTRSYKNAKDVEWSLLKDRRLMVHFSDNDVQARIFYNKGGYQLGMIRYYTEDKLPFDVRHLVRSTYYDFNIFLVIETTVRNETAYLVKIKDRSHTKTIRVVNGEMETIEEFENL